MMIWKMSCNEQLTHWARVELASVTFSGSCWTISSWCSAIIEGMRVQLSRRPTVVLLCVVCFVWNSSWTRSCPIRRLRRWISDAYRLTRFRIFCTPVRRLVILLSMPIVLLNVPIHTRIRISIRIRNRIRTIRRSWEPIVLPAMAIIPPCPHRSI